jgi:hypothetical protein
MKEKGIRPFWTSLTATGKLAVTVALVAAVAVIGFAAGNILMFCKASFLTTALVYALLAAGPAYYVKMGSGRIQNVSLSAVSVLMLFFCAEVFLRYVRRDPITYSEMHGNGYLSMYRTDALDNWYVLRWEGRSDIRTLEWRPFEVRDNTTLDYSCPDYTCNAKGLRGRLPLPDQRVVLAVGDSFTEGAGTPCDSTYPFLLEKHLHEQDTSWAVVNARVSGNDPFFDWMMVHKLLADYDIEKVVFLINTMDVNDIQMRGGMERFLQSGELDYPDGPWWVPLYAVSFVSSLFLHGVIQVGRKLMTSEEHVLSMQHAIGLIAELFSGHVIPDAEENGISGHAVLHPLLDETRGQATVYRPLKDALSGVQWLSFTNCMADIVSNTDSETLYWSNDRHFKPIGYARLAQCVYERNFADHDSSAAAE